MGHYFSVCAHMDIAMDEMYKIKKKEEQESTGQARIRPWTKKRERI